MGNVSLNKSLFDVLMGSFVEGKNVLFKDTPLNFNVDLFNSAGRQRMHDVKYSKVVQSYTFKDKKMSLEGFMICGTRTKTKRDTVILGLQVFINGQAFCLGQRTLYFDFRPQEKFTYKEDLRDVLNKMDAFHSLKISYAKNGQRFSQEEIDFFCREALRLKPGVDNFLHECFVESVRRKVGNIK